MKCTTKHTDIKKNKHTDIKKKKHLDNLIMLVLLFPICLYKYIQIKSKSNVDILGIAKIK
ncbi:hypothetical protein FDB43_08080 [Clostridium botulinum]|nr:hypothetical protein [Clostridium botulinum]